MPPTPLAPEPITPAPVHTTPRPLLTQSWLDLAFVHWAVDPADITPLLPAGTVPDTLDGATYVGLVAFRMHRVGWFRLPGVPYLGTFPETNVRLYTVDASGRRGVVFRSLDASRLIPVAIARTFLRLPYLWSRMSISRSADTISYHSRRRWPGPRGAHSRLTIRLGEEIEEPTALEHFLTARWGMHSSFFGRPMYLPNTHPRWPLHRAELIECHENLVTAAGLPEPCGTPASVLYSPGVPVRFGRPARPGGTPAPAREAAFASEANLLPER
ncbi:YqjF family protein [Streptomyces nigrescens]|uniref:YqjF family protein n=1 Tax=Streptomyces nigrescens TaxID=1920 RepID=UPI001357AC2B